LKSSRQIDADGTVELGVLYGRGPLKAPRSSGINGAKSCILGLSWHLISFLKLHFFCTIFLIFSAIVQDKRPFFTTFDYIVAVIQALQSVDYKELPASLSILCFLKKSSSEPCLHLFLLGGAIHVACLIRVLLYRRNVYNFVKRHSELIAKFLKKLEKKTRICNPDNSVPLHLRFHLRWAENNDWYYSG
jgi:hypothetical protein